MLLRMTGEGADASEQGVPRASPAVLVIRRGLRGPGTDPAGSEYGGDKDERCDKRGGSAGIWIGVPGRAAALTPIRDRGRVFRASAAPESNVQ